MDAVALIDRLIKEHKVIFRQARDIEQKANDIQAAAGLKEAKESFVPGRLDQRQGLEKLWELLLKIEEGLDHHFNLEETSLLDAFEKQADESLVSALNVLLGEHENLKSRIAHAKKHVVELMEGGLGRHKWEASAHDMQAHFTLTLKMLGEHADKEMVLFRKLRRKLNISGR